MTRIILYIALKKESIRIDLISFGSLADPLLMAQTTDMLSQRQTTFVPPH